MTLKLIFVQLILSLCFLGCCYGQTDEPIKIPVLKEDARVDSVLDKFVVKSRVYLASLFSFRRYNEEIGMLLNDSCLLLHVYTGDSVNDLGIYLSTKTKPSMNDEINICEQLKLKYACFYYKGNYVFVWTRDDFGWLFSKTNYTKTYDFVYYAIDTQTYPDERIADGVSYQFKNGTFSDRGVPTIITKKGNK